MGKKSRKNKTGKTTALPGTAGGSANATGVTLTLLPPTGCCHGSKIADFKNPDYLRATQAYIRVRFEMKQIIQARKSNHYNECQLLMQKFDEDHKYLTSYDTNFCAFIFGFCAHFYLKKDTSASTEIKGLLELGLRLRYIEHPMQKGVDIGPSTEARTKCNKYTTDINLERGMIKCLARETPCDCMKPKKLEAQMMDKTGICSGCKNEVPKNILKLCTGCNVVKYCSRECQVNGWPEHREVCKLNSHHNKKKNENIVEDRHGGESAVGQRQKPEQVTTGGKENSNISVLRPMGWTTPFESNYVGKYDREDQCVSCQGLIDIDNHPWFCGYTGRILMV